VRTRSSIRCCQDTGTGHVFSSVKVLLSSKCNGRSWLYVAWIESRGHRCRRSFWLKWGTAHGQRRDRFRSGTRFEDTLVSSLHAASTWDLSGTVAFHSDISSKTARRTFADGIECTPPRFEVLVGLNSLLLPCPSRPIDGCVPYETVSCCGRWPSSRSILENLVATKGEEDREDGWFERVKMDVMASRITWVVDVVMYLLSEESLTVVAWGS
jgi:hypothetical protein